MFSCTLVERMLINPAIGKEKNMECFAISSREEISTSQR